MTTAGKENEQTDRSAISDITSDPALTELRNACVAFFAAVSGNHVYRRRPPLALRLPQDEFVTVVKPTTTHRHGEVRVDGRGIGIEVLKRCPDVVGNTFPVKMLRVVVEESARPTMWRLNGEGIGAARALIQASKAFVDDPRSIVQRNKDNCCCCGKPLRDEISRARGVGPECLTKMGMFFSKGAFQAV